MQSCFQGTCAATSTRSPPTPTPPCGPPWTPRRWGPPCALYQTGYVPPWRREAQTCLQGRGSCSRCARALLRAPRLLVLDESTSACDGATDAAIQVALRHHFAQATVLTIAHRLHTVEASDYVLVLDGGRVAEYGPPADLLARPGGAFRALVDETARGVSGLGGAARAASAADLLAWVAG